MVKGFETFSAVAAYLDRPNVDTDLIIPKQFLKKIGRSGFGANLFHDLRFLPDGEPDPGFILNQERYKGAGILVSRENFGCGSSREHAAWALEDYGFKTIIAPSFGDIFRNNSFNIGLLLVEQPEGLVTDIMDRIEKNPGYTLRVDLDRQTIEGSDGWKGAFEIDPHRRRMLLSGFDEILLTLRQEDLIAEYERTHAKPWQAALPGQSFRKDEKKNARGSGRKNGCA
ncbi:MAG: 3-isopropylmalate dehydratase small subunit [Deltaproteobacteria bacterium]|jgi:3-isopropylmalate/(R)-2-methylmalate dehydratase small subunit|nr:3-isopropylmalate dehydratase small subunit [Deltaproteobacteria bacterium]